MSSMNIDTAQQQYYNRPKDERFESLDALITAAQYDKDHSREVTYNLRDLRAVTTNQERPELRIESPKGRATLSHYAFGQVCTDIGAPARYLRSLPADLVAQNLNHGLQVAAPVGTRSNLLVRANGGEPIIRAATSDTYGRVWDADLYRELARHFGDGARSSRGTSAQWQTPPAWPGSPASGNYRGDRDSFVIRVDGGSIVDDPSAARSQSLGDSAMYRGILVRNSEVGHCSVTLEMILFRYICGNHMLWGAILDRQFRRRHVGTNAVRDTMSEINRIAWKWNDRAASTDEQIIRSLIEHEIAHTKEAVIDELKKLGATQRQAESAYTTCEQTESASPRSFWGLAQGLTRDSQESGYQDDRLDLDRLASQVLKRGVLVAA